MLSAQVGNCDSVQVLDIKLNPFNTNQIMVRSAYTDFDNFISYPTFSLVDDNDFILAMETLNFFGMSIEQIHQVDIIDMDIEPGVTIPATLELWSFNYENLECTFEDDYLLWPVQECVPLTLTMNITAEDSVATAGTVSWNITYSSGETTELVIIQLDSAAALINWELCLPEGCDYELELGLSGFEGVAVSYSLHYSSSLAIGPSGWLLEDETVNHSFNLYNCFPTSIEPLQNDELILFPNPAGEFITVQFPGSFDELLIVIRDQNGRMIKSFTRNGSGSGFTFDTSDLTDGIYHISVTAQDGKKFHQRVVVAH